MKKQTMTRDNIATARTLSEALPYLQRFNDAIVVVKFGGNAMGDDEAMASFARDIVLLRQVGVNPVVVHGGGPMINEMLAGSASHRLRERQTRDRRRHGRGGRNGPVGPRQQAHRAGDQRQGGKAVGLSGKDASLITCDPADPANWALWATRPR
jgi:acetylglutamate kinase